MSHYVILPGCDDGNRGDQALVWETVSSARKAGFDGAYYMLCSPENVGASVEEGIVPLMPILKHPGRHSTIRNQRYGLSLLVQWGITALGDYIRSRRILKRVQRGRPVHGLTDEERDALHMLMTCDACFVKGGGFLHSYGSLTDIYQMYFFLYHIRLAQAMEKPVYIMPNSFGPFKAPTVKWQIRKALAGCRRIMARESISQKMLEDIGVSCDLFPDLAFGLQKSALPKPSVMTASGMAGRTMVGITVRPYRFPGADDPSGAYEAYVQSFVQFSRWLYEHDAFPVFVEHVLSHNEHESDWECIQRVTEKLEPGQYVVVRDSAYTCRDMKAVYSYMDCVIGTRFHSVIFSLSEGVPCVAVAYGGNKGVGIMRDLDLEEYMIEIEHVTFEQLKQCYQNLMNEREAYVTRLDKQCVRLSKCREQMCELLSE